MPEPSVLPIRAIRAALARRTYAGDRVRLTGASLAGCECLISSRQGLYGVDPGGRVVPVAYGHFFGIRAHGDSIYTFESCDGPFEPTMMGRILQWRRDGDRLLDPVALIKGLHNQCHQIAVFDESLCVVDTASQAVLQFTLEGRAIARHEPFPLAPPQDTSGGYLHVNSVARIGDRIALMLHNGVAEPARPSELAWLDSDWRLIAREPVAGYRCHDIVAEPDGTLWHCGSMAGELINSAGLNHKISDSMTRGLAVTPDRIVIGSSDFATRAKRAVVAGHVHFLDRDLEVQAKVAVPAAATDLMLW